jgi:hypothetical protein
MMGITGLRWVLNGGRSGLSGRCGQAADVLGKFARAGFAVRNGVCLVVDER